MLVISAMVTIAEGKGDEFVAEFAKLAPKVRRDPGCLTYVMHRMIGSPDRFFVFEQYTDEEAFKYHGSTPHFLAYRQATAHLVKGRDIGRWEVAV
jgi:quinol monooxygenase YgiN